MEKIHSINDDYNEDSIHAEFGSMIKETADLLKSIENHNNKQVIAVRIANGKIYKAVVDQTSASDADREEQKLLDAIGDNDAVTQLICCWSGGCFDVPSYNFRKKLCELNPNNESALMLLQGKKSFITKAVKVTLR